MIHITASGDPSTDYIVTGTPTLEPYNPAGFETSDPVTGKVNFSFPQPAEGTYFFKVRAKEAQTP